MWAAVKAVSLALVMGYLCFLTVSGVWLAVRWLAWETAKLLGIPLYAIVDVTVKTASVVYEKATYQPTRTERLQSLIQRTWDLIARSIEWAFEFLTSFVEAEVLLGLIWLVLSIGLAYVVVRTALGYWRASSLRRRGMIIEGEARIPGSNYTLAEAPSFVVGISSPGILLGDTSVGHGMRISDTLVMPQHVYRQAGAEQGLILRNPSKPERPGIPISCQLISSRQFNDVGYVHLSAATWARLGVTQAPSTVRVKEQVIGVAWGPQGFSSGPMYRAQQDGLVHYEGSTEPGYSGSPYLVKGRLAGMHLGAVTSKMLNIGVAAWAIEAEVGHLEKMRSQLQPEAYVNYDVVVKSDYLSDHSAEKNAQALTEQDDQDRRLEDQLDQSYGVYKKYYDDAADELARKQRVQKKFLSNLATGNTAWYDEMDEEARKHPFKAAKAAVEAMTGAQRKLFLNHVISLDVESMNELITPHGKGQPGQLLLQDTAAREQIAQLRKRVEALERKINPVLVEGEARKPKAKPKVEKVQEPAKPQPKTKPLQKSASAEEVKPALDRAPAKETPCIVCGKKFPSGMKAKAHQWFDHTHKELKDAKRKRGVSVKAEAAASVVEATTTNEDSPKEQVRTDAGSFLGKTSLQRRSST